jgi:hypothetical protein
MRRQGRVADVVVPALASQLALWDLVYNGIRHSEAAGAEVDARTRKLLALPPRDGRPQ